MTEQHDPLVPQRVDESIEALSPFDSVANVRPADPDRRLIFTMHLFYRLKRRQYDQALQRVEERLLAGYGASDDRPTLPLKLVQPGKTFEQDVPRQMSQPARLPTRVSPGRRRFGLLAAVLVMIVLVGSMVMVLRMRIPYLLPGVAVAGTPIATATGTVCPAMPSAIDTPSSAPTSATGSSSCAITPTSTPTATPAVSPLYTSPPTSLIGTIAWSPDGKRIAALSSDDLEVWDATTGGYLLKVPVSSERTIGQLAWSPNGQWIALATIAEGLVIVNAQTGHTTYHLSSIAQADKIPALTGSVLSASVPASGLGEQVTGLAWSADSQRLAFSVSVGTSTGATASIVVLNVYTGMMAQHISLAGNIAVANWSPDDKYLAANVEDPDGVLTVRVWDMSTYHAVFEQNGGGTGVVQQYAADQIVWQPQSDNLAFAVQAANSLTFANIEVWNVPQNKQLEQFSASNMGLLAWSPDGQSLAAIVFTKKGTGKSQVTYQSLVILNAQSGQQTYNYDPDSRQYISYQFLAWSPDGKYIATLQYAQQNMSYTDVSVWATP